MLEVGCAGEVAEVEVLKGPQSYPTLLLMSVGKPVNGEGEEVEVVREDSLVAKGCQQATVSYCFLLSYELCTVFELICAYICYVCKFLWQAL